jgi:hypothetical protein
MFAVARALPFQTRRTLIFRMTARIARGEDKRAKELALQALTLDPHLSAEYIRTQEFFEDRTIVDELAKRAFAAGLPAAPVRVQLAS